MWGLSLQPSVRPQNMETLASRLEKAGALRPQISEEQQKQQEQQEQQEQEQQGLAVDNSSHPVEENAAPDKQKKNFLPFFIAGGVVAVIAIIAAICLL